MQFFTRYLSLLESLGRAVTQVVSELGYLGALLAESLYWLFVGPRRGQAVSLSSIVKNMMQVGVQAIPIVTVLSFGVGIMLAIQGIHTMRAFGAESQVVVGIAWSITREFASLIVGILVAGRSGSALAARIGTMVVNQEIDALRVIGISPVRYLVAPMLVAMFIMVPSLTILADVMGLLGGGVFTAIELRISLSAYFQDAMNILSVSDIMQGVVKAAVFAVIITVVGAGNGFLATGGAEGVGRITTRSVVLSIAGIILADMAFTFFMTRAEG